MFEEVLESIDISKLSRYLYDVSKFFQKIDMCFDDFTIKVADILPNFAKDNNIRSLYIIKTQDGKINVTLEIPEDFREAQQLHTLVVIKNCSIIDLDDSIENQLNVINLCQKIEFEGLNAFVAYGISSLFEMLVVNPNFDITKDSITMTKKRIQDLSITLQNLKQHIEVPDLSSTVHPLIKEIVSKGANQKNFREFLSDEELSNSVFLNDLQKISNGWIKAVQNLIQLSRNIDDDSAIDEINFWINLERSLLAMEKQIFSQEAQLTLSVLTIAKRFHATVSFIADTGLKDRIQEVKGYNQFLEAFKLDLLTTASCYEDIETFIETIIVALRKWRVSIYPVSRCTSLFEKISEALDKKLRDLLPNLVVSDYQLVEEHYQNVMKVISQWDDVLKDLTSLARELIRKRSENFFVIKMDSKTDELKETLKYIFEFRKKHELLIMALKNIDYDTLNEDILYLYEPFNSIDPLHEPLNVWKNMENIYIQRVHRLEGKLVNLMEGKLRRCEESNLMFIVFKKYRPLLERPRIQNAIREYQHELLNSVKVDLKNIRTKLNEQRYNSDISHIKDIPPISASILWYNQVKKHLETVMSRLHLIIGPNWEEVSEGRDISRECNVILEKLDVNRLFESWTNDTAKYNSLLQEPIFKVLKRNNGLFELYVNFDSQVGFIFKELRNLSWMGFAIPTNITKISRVVRYLYPHAIMLSESLNLFIGILEGLEDRKNTMLLLKEEEKNIWILIKDIALDTWDSIPFIESEPNETLNENNEIYNKSSIKTLEVSINEVLDKFQRLKFTEDELSKLFSQLNQISFDRNSLVSIIQEIQDIVDHIVLSAYNNIDEFLDYLNWNIGSILIGKVRSLFSNPKFPLCKHTIIQNGNTISISPSLEQTKIIWIVWIQDIVNIITHLPKLSINKYSAKSSCGTNTYQELIGILETNIKNVYENLEVNYQKAKTHFGRWKELESLWILSESLLFDSIGNDLEFSYNILVDFLENKKFVDEAESEVSPSPFVIINQEHAILRISGKYKFWQSELIKKVLDLYVEKSIQFELRLVNSRKELESINISLATLDKMTHLISYMDDLKKGWECDCKLINTLYSIQLIFQKLRVKLGSNFIYYDQLRNDMDTLEAILLNKESKINENKDIIASKLELKAQEIDRVLQALVDNWSNKKPVSVTIESDDALAILSSFEEEIDNIVLDIEIVLKSAKILSIPISIANYSLPSIKEEVLDYKAVWTCVDRLWKMLQTSLSVKWIDIQINELQQRLTYIIKESKNMPSKILHYNIFQNLMVSIQSISDSIQTLTLLKDPSIKERHWILLFNQLANDSNEEIIGNIQFTLYDVLELNLVVNESLIMNTVQQAQNEFVLERSIGKIIKRWKSIVFSKFTHSSGTLLIREWDEIFNDCRDDIDTLVSMKSSLYYKVFEQEAIEWETKLSRLYEILTDWLEVQKHWIYFYGVLGKNSDLKSLLPAESLKFSTVTAEFKILLSKLYHSDIVVDVLHVPDCLPTLRQIIDSFNNIKKSLNHFLESQRKLFPRFYFVGNEDLLQIVGANENLNHLSRYFQMMYTGISSLILRRNHIIGVLSPEGETLLFLSHIDVLSSTKVDQWINEFDLEIKLTLSSLVQDCIQEYRSLDNLPEELIDKYPFQVLLLTLQIFWTSNIEENMGDNGFIPIKHRIELQLKDLATYRKNSTKYFQRRKAESLIVELTHIKHTVDLVKGHDRINAEFYWNKAQKFYYNSQNENLLERITIKQLGYSFTYGFEYIGVPERLIYTPLLENCFDSMANSLYENLGGSPFGPAGTGKTETIKALGQNFGRMVLVFNCDASFDFHSISRLLFGITQIGAWGCFDEFNRLDENILSAVSTQIEIIQSSLMMKKTELKLLEKFGHLNPNTGIFITMNPGYIGRSELPENLKKMFREFSMKKPDSVIIAEVVLRTLGLVQSRDLAKKIVNLFERMGHQLSSQKHYDFGLRALKGVLRNCQNVIAYSEERDSILILLQSLNEMIAPKLVNYDEEYFNKLINEIFHISYSPNKNIDFLTILEDVCMKKHLVLSNNFTKKCLQFHDVQRSQQAVILVGPPGSGKTSIWRSVLDTLKKQSGIDNHIFVIDNKAISKDELYGILDNVTFEWKDGLFTSILRKVNEDSIGSFQRGHVWVIFDSDLDPNYAETLNSVLDDNKILTLPNGERLKVPHNFHIIFEVPNLDHVTPATISRCGMIWVSDRLISNYEIMISIFSQEKFTHTLSQDILMALEKTISSILSEENLSKIINISENYNHILGFDILRSIQTLATFMCNELSYDNVHSLPKEEYCTFIKKKLYIGLIWAFSGDSMLSERVEFNSQICKILNITDISIKSDELLIDYDVSLDSQSWIPISNKVPQSKLESHEILLPGIIIPTVDTIKHEALLFNFLNQKQALILCGPPGSGKTMTLYSALKKSEKFEVIGMNFSKETSINLVLKSLEQHTSYISTSSGLTMQPKILGKQLVLFCDEINLPQLDSYGSQPVILFLRQLIEKKGFWNTKENRWVTLEGIQVVGACNPSTDSGRIQMTERFTRHTSIIMVDYPGRTSLIHIYEIMFQALMKLVPGLTQYSLDFAKASYDVYNKSKNTFLTTRCPHYVYSPRELTRWVRGMYNAITNTNQLLLIDIVRIWVHEAIRLFADRLVDDEDKQKFHEILCVSMADHFPNVSLQSINFPVILFSSWLSLNYKNVNKEELKGFIKERMKTFSEEEIETDIVIYDDLVDHMLRIDRVMKQVQGHAILVGPSCTGKSTMTKFVSWLNGFTVIKPCIYRNFGIKEFDDFLRKLLLKCGTESQKMCLIIDESNILETSFLERMNTLLANSDVPGLFEEKEYEELLFRIRQKIQQLGLLLDTEQEMYEWFKEEISKNLHVIFTINDHGDQDSTQLLTSPALLNRCVMNWIGHWSNTTYFQIANDVVQNMPLDNTTYEAPSNLIEEIPFPEMLTIRDVVINYFILVQYTYKTMISSQNLCPNLFLDSLNYFKKNYIKKLDDLEEQQRFTSVGLDKLKETVLKVKQLNEILSSKQERLRSKEQEARKTLDRMLIDQNEAERKQEASIEIQKILETQDKEINKRKLKVMEDLALAEPAILEAQQGVKNIKKQQFTELRSMLNPPDAVKTTLEAVCIILGYTVKSWRDIQSVIRKDDFVTDIVNYDTNLMMTDKMRSYITEEYLSRTNFRYEDVNRASKACGPLYQWIIAQLKYSEMLVKVGPLKEQADKLQQEMVKTKARLMAADEMITELERSIEFSKNEYSKIIRDVEVIKDEMERVHEKVNRSVTLIQSLNSEKSRWVENTNQFKKWKKTLIGNCLLSSVYQAYCGYHDQKFRLQFLNILKTRLTSFKVDFDSNFDFTTHMVDLPTKAKWLSCQLPDETLFVENFYMIMNGDHYPYVIDPSGKILNVLFDYYDQKLVLSSFLDHGFVKRLENTLRFGGCIVMQDSEFFDPIISQLISKEFGRMGGRRTIKIGDNEIDVSSEFQLILYSKNGHRKLPTFLHSRVTLVNFTINKGSIHAQSLQITLLKEKPKIQKQRNDLIRLNNEYKLRLRSLEKSLLDSLNEAEGNILENGDLVDTLEQLKIESNEVSKKLQETNDVINQVEDIIDEYYQLGEHCILIFTLLEKMSTLQQFYRIPISQFLECFESIFDTVEVEGKSRSEQLLFAFYKQVYYRFANLFLEIDKITFGVLLFISYHTSQESQTFHETLDHIFNIINSDRPLDQLIADIKALIVDTNSSTILNFFDHIKSGNYLRGLKYLSYFFLDGGEPWYLSEYISLHGPKAIILGCDRGVDGTFKIQQVANHSGLKLHSIALGSSESISIAEQKLNICAVNGEWILLQNLQMSPEWARTTLPKRIDSLLCNTNTSTNFKIFMTCRLHGRTLEVPLLNSTYKMVYEGEPGILNTVLQLWMTQVNEKIDGPVEIFQVKFLLGWYHALIVERGRYSPIGFQKKYDFHEGDFHTASKFLDHVFKISSNGKQHIDPNDIPWETIEHHLSYIIYGGKIDNDEDLRWCFELSRRLFNVRCYDNDFEIVKGLINPEIRCDHKSYMMWIKNLNAVHDTYHWLDLPASAEETVQMETAKQVCRDVKVLKPICQKS